MQSTAKLVALALAASLCVGCATVQPKDIALAGLGVIASIATHEAGHFIVAEAQGEDIAFQGLNWKIDNEGNDLLRNAGLIAQGISSELILATKVEGPFWFGFLATNTVEEISYPAFRAHTGDFKDMDNQGFWRAFWIAHGTSVAARMVHRKSWNWMIRPEDRGASIVYRAEF